MFPVLWIALEAPPLERGFPSDRLADPAQLLQHCSIDAVDDLVANSVDPRTAERVVALVPGAGAGPVLRSGGDQRDAAFRGVEVGGGARLGEVAA